MSGKNSIGNCFPNTGNEDASCINPNCWKTCKNLVQQTIDRQEKTHERLNEYMDIVETEFKEHCENINQQGFTVVANTFTDDECETAKHELDRLVEEIETGGMECLFNKVRVFERVYRIPHLLRIVRHFLGSDALLGGVFGSIIDPGKGDGGLHADGEITGSLRPRSQAPADKGLRITSHTMGLNSIFCISDFAAGNGATRLVPGSHRVETIDIPDTASEQALIVEAPRGSTIVFDTNIWHGSSANRTEQKRYALLVPWRRNWQKGAYELSRIVKPEVIERAGEDRQVFGEDATPPYLELWQWDREKGEPKPEFREMKRT